MPQFGPYPARVDLVHDGDTVYLSIDLGFDHLIASHDFDGHPRLACRLQTVTGQAINAPELSTGAGKEALLAAQALLPQGTRVQTISFGWDKYGGRYDGSITLPDGRDFAQTMVDSGQAVLVNY